MNARVLETIKKSAAVPSMPQVVLRFLEIMQDPNFDYADLVRVLSTDPGTVGEILYLANSALFGVRNKVVSPKQALALLGPKRTRSLLLGRYLVDTLSKKRVAGLDMGYFWRRSLACSVVASHFAEASDVLTDMLRHSSFDPTEIEKERRVIIEEINMTMDAPDHWVGILLGQVIWPDHPLGRDVAGTRETVSLMTRERLLDYLERHYLPRILQYDPADNAVPGSPTIAHGS